MAATDNLVMSQPRMTFAGTTLHITRTTIGRFFLLRPDPVVNQILLFCLFRAADIYGVSIHSAIVESNHVHLVVTDMKGKISEFMHWFSMMSAKNLIAHYEKQYPDMYLAEIWSKDHFNATVLPNANAAIRAISYDQTNPVKDGLVRDFRDWPGLKSRPGDWMQPARTVRRPEGLAFSDRGKKHREVKVEFTVPPALRDRPVELAVDAVNAVIRGTMTTIWAEFARTGRTFLGVKGVLAVSPFDSPNKPRIKGSRVPTFAAGGDTTLLNEGLKLVRNFQLAYRQAWTNWRNGMRDVCFPAGTYLMRVRCGCACDDWSPPWCCAA